MYQDNQPVITGIALATPIGNSPSLFFENALNGKSGIKKINTFNVDNFKTQIGGIVENIEVEKPHFLSDKVTHLALYVTRELLKSENILNKLNKDKVGIIVGTAEGPAFKKIEFVEKTIKNPKYSSFYTIPASMINVIASYLSIDTGFRGTNLTVSTTCSSSSNAILTAEALVKSGVLDGCLVVGVECPLNPIHFQNWDRMRILSRSNKEPEKACKPFSLNRDGTVFSEAAGAIFIERYGDAKKRDVPIHASIAGCGASSNSDDLLKPSIEGQVLCMQNALANSRLNIDDIDYIHAHGNGTIFNDLMETETIKEVFKERAYDIPVSTIKSMIGHTAGACGIVSVITTVLSMKSSRVIPTINYEEPDPECDLNYVPNKAIEHKINRAVVNAFGFGGSNVSIVLGKV